MLVPQGAAVYRKSIVLFIIPVVYSYNYDQTSGIFVALSSKMLPQSRVQRWLYALFANFAIFIGTTSYRYDFGRRLYTRTKWSQPIASFANLLVIGLILSNLYLSWKKSEDMDLATGTTIRMDTTVNDLICLLHVLQRVPRERVTKGIAHELRRLQRIYRCRRPGSCLEQEQYLKRILLLKQGALWALLVFLMGFMQVTQHLFGLELHNVLSNRALVAIYVLAMDGQEVIMQLHFIFTWLICDSYMCLNARIRILLAHGDNDAASLLELQHLRWQHWHLGRLWHRLNVSYYFILLSSRFSLMVTAAALGYYISVFRSLDCQRIYQFTGLGLYVVIVLDCYIFDLICDRTVSAYRESTALLLPYSENLHRNDRLARGVIRKCICLLSSNLFEIFFQCQLFALQIANFPLQIKPYGLFASGKATLLSNIACIISWMVVLLQYRMVSERQSYQLQKNSI